MYIHVQEISSPLSENLNARYKSKYYTYVQVCAHVFLTTDLTFPVCMFPQLHYQVVIIVQLVTTN